MEFKPLYFADRLHIINRHGVIGVVTLWSKPEYVIERFREAGVDLNPATSLIAVFGTLYGNGLREMLRNLLYNPQIQVLLICGHDRSGSQQELLNFFELGLEPVAAGLVRYRQLKGIEEIVPARIRNTTRLIDNLVQPQFYYEQPDIILLGDPKDDVVLGKIHEFFNLWKPKPKAERTRRNVPLPEVELQYFPSNPRAHQIVKDSPLEAWAELIFLLTRFGRKVTLAKGERLELQNIKVVVEKPQFDRKDSLKKFNISPERLVDYQKEIIRSNIKHDKASLKGQDKLPYYSQTRPDETYSYGNRLRLHFEIDALAYCASRLKNDPEDRKAYFTLWDNKKDLKAESGHPCFVSLFFRKFEDKLTLTSTFRTHNALDAWLLNFYGLMAIQKWVASRAGIHQGPITVISHSISVDPRELDRALTVVEKRTWKMHLDPQGYFRVTLDGDEILAEHRFEDVTLKEYRGRTAVAIQHQIARDLAVSDLNHALYLGRQLAKAEMALKEGREFVQE